jgi:hypothetical protein
MVNGTNGLTGLTAMLTAELELNIDPEPVKVQKMVEETAKEKAVKIRTVILQDYAQV